MAVQFDTVLVSVEDPQAPRELREAERLLAEGGHIHVLSVIEESDRTALDKVLDGLRTATAPLVRGARVSLHARVGKRAEETLRLAAEANADLIILGAYQPASTRVVAKVMSWAACSVFVLAPNTEASGTKGFVPLFPQCTDCVKVRREATGAWHCELHQAPTRYAYESRS